MKPKPLSGLSSIFFRDLSTIYSETYRMKKATKSVLYYIAVLAGLILVLVVARTIYRQHKLASRIVQSKKSYDTKTVEHVERVEAFVENVIQKQPLKNMSTPKLLRAAKVAHLGVPGKWMSDGRFIEGIKPNPEYAVPAYAELLKRKQYSILEDYSRLMEYGVPQSDQIVNKSLALQLYQLMFNRTTDIYKKFDLLDAIKRLSPAHEQHRLAFQQSQIAQQITEDAARKAENDRNLRARQIAPGRTTTRVRPRQDDGIWILPDFAFEGIHADTAPVAAVAPRADAQNVHDSTVVRTVKASVDRLRSAVGTQPVNQNTAQQIRHLISGANVGSDKKRKAMQALDTIERTNQNISSANTSELELLDLVWKRMHHEDNKDNGQVLEENLINELSDSIEHNVPVCSTGRFTRVLDTLNGVDDLVQIKPKWALQQELVEKAGVIYKEQVGKLPEADRVAVEAIDPSPEQQATCDTIIDKVKSDIKNDFKTTYVDSGVLTEDALNVELSKFIDAIA